VRSACAAVALCLAVACDRVPREPVELDLTSFGLVYVDGESKRPDVEEAGGHRRILEAPGQAFEVFVRLPHDARLRFTIDPHTPPETFAVVVRAGEREEAARVRRLAEGDWEATLDQAEEGTIVRLRLENRGTAPLAWWAPRLVGTARTRAPILSAADRPHGGTPNVVLVLVDALRADHLSLLGHRRPTTPELARLAAAHGIVFERAYAAGPSTPNSIPTIFTSRYPSVLGINFRASTAATERTLAEAFSLGGVRTAAFVANPLMMEVFGYSRGFAAYEILRRTDAESRFVRADAMVDRAIEYLGVNRDAPSFVYLHLMDVHSPFDPPPPYRGRFAGDGVERPTTPRRAPEVRPAQNDDVEVPDREGPWRPSDRVQEDLDPTHYDEAIAWVDSQIARLIQRLDEMGLGERTAIVVTADHGEALGNEDDGRFLHGHAVFEELARVPLVVLLPWLDHGRRIDRIVSLIDLAPTLLDLAGVAIPQSFAGTTLFHEPPSADPPAALLERLEPQWTPRHVLGPGRFGVAEWALREGSWKLVMDESRVRLFDLASDPKETTDVHDEHPDVTGYLIGRTSRLSPGLSRRERPPTVDPAGGAERPLTEALKALGYLAD
jgi:arylsulfatase A-like enzyme